MKDFFTIKENTTAEIQEKKSKFIANLFYVESKDQAEDIIKQIKKKYFDARHNCLAYRIYTEEGILEKSSDDGEPSGTAGAPMLDILKSQNLCNVLIIVTRYFGGILLGTGGLVRAYTQATLNAIEKSTKVCKNEGYKIEVKLDYNNLELFKNYCKKNNINIINTQYLDIIVAEIETEIGAKDQLNQDISAKKINVKELTVLCKKIINKSVK